MGGTSRRAGFVVMVFAIALLLLTLLATRSRTNNVSPQADRAPAQTAAPLPTSTPTPNPFAVSTDDESVTINRLWSPNPLTARAEGTTSRAGMIVAVETDGRALPPLTLDADADGNFSVDIRGLEPGPQQVCVAGACQRVLVAEPNQEARAVVEARIDQAIEAARARFDLDTLIPGWTFVISGPNSSVGGSADPQTKTITINANSGRTFADYEITVIHEIGHAVDDTWLDDAGRDTFRELRRLDAGLPWGAGDGFTVGTDRWSDAGEDFAEMFVALALGTDYVLETSSIATQPSPAELRDFCALIGANSLGCE